MQKIKGTNSCCRFSSPWFLHNAVSRQSTGANRWTRLRPTFHFSFHAGNVKLPAGRYFIHVLDNTDLTVMEITSADGSTSALFDVQGAQANSSRPRAN